MARPPDRRQLKAITTLREPLRRRLYEYVERQPGAVSRDQAAQAVGITRVLAAFHLDKLVDVGLLRPEYRRLSSRTGRGAGRTSKLYRRSRREFEVTLPPRDHRLLARFLAAALMPTDDTLLSVESARGYGRSLGRRARGRIGGGPTEDRLLECVERILERLGFEPYRPGDAEVRLRNCPFDPLSRRFTPVVCGAGLALVAGIVEGVEAQVRVAREEGPDRCCITLGPTRD